MSNFLGAKLSNFRRPFKSAKFPLTLKQLPWLLIAIGIILRLAQYLLNHSLWIDEAFVVINILNRSFAELLQPLDYNQGAPVGFLFVEKAVVNLLGDSEYAFRLFPFFCGIISLFLFYLVAKKLTYLPTVCIALGLFALCDRLIYYSAEVKQYSSDVATALLIYVAVINLPSSKLNLLKVVGCGIIGAVAVWMSHPSVLVLAGTGLTILVVALIKKEWSRVVNYLIIFSLWAISFLAFYWISVRSLVSNEDLQSSWGGNHDSFVPLIPSSLTDIRWFIDKFFEIFNYPLGIHLTGIAAFAFIIGCASLWFQQKQTLFLLISPVLVTIFVSGLHKYPFKGQLLLFIIPSMLLIIAEGARQIFETTRLQSRLIGITFVVLLFFYPVYYGAVNLRTPRYSPQFEYQRVREDIKPVLSYIQQNREPGDALYVYYAAQYAFRYYSDRYGFDYATTGEAVWPEPPEDWFAPAFPSYPPQLIVGEYSRDDWSTFEQELNQLRGNSRVWFLFSHVVDRRTSLDEEDFFLYLMERMGTQLDSFESKEASVYLYDLSGS